LSLNPVSSRDQILDGARTLIATHGYDGMTISDLSAISGLPPSSIYYHFESKLGVLAALLDRTFEDLHASDPGPSSFDGHPPLERFELWFTRACASLDERPEYLRLLLAVCIGSHAEVAAVRDVVGRIRDYAHQSWLDVLGPMFDPEARAEDEATLQQLAVLGRAVTDGLSVSTTFDGSTYSSHVAPFVGLIRSFIDQRTLEGRGHPGHTGSRPRPD
jgi:AcrR family transcriptional regulator